MTMLRANATHGMLFLGLALSSTAWAAEPPTLVSPGQFDKSLATIEARCPSFDWTSVEGADYYELTVYEAENRSGEPVISQVIPGAANGWTPALGKCLERGSDYVWTVRAVGSGFATDWAEASPFAVDTGLSAVETEAIIAALAERGPKILGSDFQVNGQGDVTAATYSGDGSALTGVNAANVTCVGCVGSTDLAAGSVDSAAIVDGTIVGADLAAEAVGSTEILDGSITSADIGANQILNANIADNQIGTAKILNGSVLNEDIADDSIGTAKILDGSILTADIADNQITSAKILDGQIRTADIGPSQITSNLIADGSISNADIADSQIGTAKILDGSILTADIANNQITSIKILDGQIRNADIGPNQITSNLIVDGSILNADIANSQIGTAKVLDGSLTGADIQNASIGGLELTSNAFVVSVEETETISNTGLSGFTFETTDIGSATRRFCFLTRVRIYDEFVNNTGAECHVFPNTGRWFLRAGTADGNGSTAGGDLDIECEARCISW